MFTSVQTVFLIDLNCLNNQNISNKDDLSLFISKLKLSCLRLLTEFGAQTDKDGEVRWAAKYYDSTTFRPGKTNNYFLDFNKKDFDLFSKELEQKFSTARKSGSLQNKSKGSLNSNHTHSFILNKAIQEALKDYNWDIPDGNSPRSKRTRSKNEDKISGPFISIIVLNNVPHNVESVQNFIGDDSWNDSPKAFTQILFENSTRQVLGETKSFRLHFVDVAASRFRTQETDINLLTEIDDSLSKFNGALHCISSLVDCSKVLKVSSSNIISPHIGNFNNLWFNKSGKTLKGRARKPQNGPELLWEDSNGISFLKVKTDVLSLQGKVSVSWNKAHVAGIAKAGGPILAAISAQNSQIILCREQASQEADQSGKVFNQILSALMKHSLIMILRLSCEGLALLSPWVGGVACLVVLSSSGLACPPISPKKEEETLLSMGREAMINFTKAAINKSLKCHGGVPDEIEESTSQGEPNRMCSFSRNMMEGWYPSNTRLINLPSVMKNSRCILKSVRHTLLNRARRRCCPQVTRLIDTATDVSSVRTTRSTSEQVKAKPKAMKGGTSTGAIKSTLTSSRALQLVNKSKIVTAQQKVKNRKCEEEEQQVERERKIQQSNLRTKKSHALINTALSSISDTKNSQEIVDSLMKLRDSVNGKFVTHGAKISQVVESCDLFGTAQTIINLALMHIKMNTTEKESKPTEMGEGLQEVLQPILHKSREIALLPEDCRLQQYQLQTLLHLEVMWLMGYSSMPLDGEEECAHSRAREDHMDEVLKLLRGISLKYNPATTSAFLSNTVLQHYGDTLSDIIKEVYEELNQPLPLSLTSPSSVAGTGSPLISHHSIKPLSALSSLGSGCGQGSSKAHGGIRRMNSNLAVGAGARRQVVVSGSRLARLGRATSDNSRGMSKNSSSSGQKSSVRRSLFDDNNSTTPASNCRKKRKRSSEMTTMMSPREKRVKRTPREERKRRSNPLQEEEIALGCSQLFTPNKREKESPSGKSYSGSTSKLDRVLVPSTPSQAASRALLRGMSLPAANESIAESPDIKSTNSYTPRKLQASLALRRRSSFYSGGESRNWQKVKTKMMVKRLQNRNKSEGSPMKRVNIAHGLDAESVNVDKNFLFSKIMSSAPQASKIVSRVDTACNSLQLTNKQTRRKGMKRMLNFDDIDEAIKQNTRNIMQHESPLRRNNNEGSNDKPTPVKKITRNLNFSMTTPTKNNKVSEQPLHLQFSRKTPKRNENVIANSPFLTPSKRVQFSLHHTPSKYSTGIVPSTTPKSILKTPNKYTPSKAKTPTRNTPSKAKTPVRGALFGSNTPTRRMHIIKTSVNKQDCSPDLFSSAKKITLESPNKTPRKLSVSPGCRRSSPRLRGSPMDKNKSPQQSPLVKTSNLSTATRRHSRVLNFAAASCDSTDSLPTGSISDNKMTSTSTPVLAGNVSTSSDSAICMDKPQFPSENEQGASSPLHNEENSPGINIDGDESYGPKEDLGEVKSVNEFIEKLDKLADQSIEGLETPLITNKDIEICNTLFDFREDRELEDVDDSHHLSMTSNLVDESMTSNLVDETFDQSMAEANPKSLLDLKTMARRDSGSIIINKDWMKETDESDSHENSSPEIELSPTAKKSIEITMNKLKENVDSNITSSSSSGLDIFKTSDCNKRIASSCGIFTDMSDSEEETPVENSEKENTGGNMEPFSRNAEPVSPTNKENTFDGTKDTLGISMFSTPVLEADNNLGVSPLQSVGNLPQEGERTRRSRQRKSYVEFPSDISELDSSVNQTNNSLNVSKNALENKESVKKNELVNNFSLNLVKVKVPTKKSKKKQKKVKLKIKKKSEDCYEVSHNVSVNTTSSETEKSAEKRKRKSNEFLTPLRFTRHMSKKSCITPEFYKKLMVGSPSTKVDSENSQEDEKLETPSTPVQLKVGVPPKSALTPSSRKDMWRVESSSPTLKKFFRVQNGAQLPGSPSNPLSPSLKSMLHLSTSPLVQNVKTRPKKEEISLPDDNENPIPLSDEENPIPLSDEENPVSDHEKSQSSDRIKVRKRKRNSSNEEDEDCEDYEDIRLKRVRRSVANKVVNYNEKSAAIRCATFTEKRILKPRSSKRLYAE